MKKDVFKQKDEKEEEEKKIMDDYVLHKLFKKGQEFGFLIKKNWPYFCSHDTKFILEILVYFRNRHCYAA